LGNILEIHWDIMGTHCEQKTPKNSRPHPHFPPFPQKKIASLSKGILDYLIG